MILSPDALLVQDGIYRWTPDRVLWAWKRVEERLVATSGPVVLMVGLPGAGKSTWLAANAREDTVYLDATSCRVRERRHIRQLLKDRPISVVWLDTPILECLARNAARSLDRQVPEKRIRSMARSLQSVPPSATEGFLSVVRIGPVLPELVLIDRPDHPLLEPAVALLEAEFGAQGEVESLKELREFLKESPLKPVAADSYSAFVVAAVCQEGKLLGVRTACILSSISLAPGLCVVFLANIVVVPEARGGEVTRMLRDAPLEAARKHLRALYLLGAWVGGQVVVVAELEPFIEGDSARVRRLKSYAKAGFMALELPYAQPALGKGQPIPMLLVVKAEGLVLEEGKVPEVTVRGILALLAMDYETTTSRRAVEQAFKPVRAAVRGGVGLRGLVG